MCVLTDDFIVLRRPACSHDTGGGRSLSALTPKHLLQTCEAACMKRAGGGVSDDEGSSCLSLCFMTGGAGFQRVGRQRLPPSPLHSEICGFGFSGIPPRRLQLQVSMSKVTDDRSAQWLDQFVRH